MYSNSAPPSVGISSPSADFDSTNNPSGVHSETLISHHSSRQGWLGHESVEIIGVPSCDDIGSVSSSSLMTSSLVQPSTPVSVVVAEKDLKPTSKASSRLQKFWSKTDLVSAFSQYQNTAYLKQELQPNNLPLLKKSIETLSADILKIPSGFEGRAKLEKLASQLINKIDAVMDGRKKYAKFSTKLFFALASMSLCILPLMVAERNNYNQLLAVVVSGYAKTMLILIGLMRSQTADSRTFMRHLKERHVPYLTPNIPFAFSTYNQAVSGFNQRNPWAFNGISAAFCALVFMMTSSPDTFKRPVEQVFNN